jgi:hypothetical protein
MLQQCWNSHHNAGLGLRFASYVLPEVLVLVGRRRRQPLPQGSLDLLSRMVGRSETSGAILDLALGCHLAEMRCPMTWVGFFRGWVGFIRRPIIRSEHRTQVTLHLHNKIQPNGVTSRKLHTTSPFSNSTVSLKNQTCIYTGWIQHACLRVLFT